MFENRLAQLDAGAADVDMAWTFDEWTDIAIVLSAKGAPCVSAGDWRAEKTLREPLPETAVRSSVVRRLRRS